MKVTRRSVIVGTGGLMAAASQIGFSQPAKADLHGVWASNFNNTLLKNMTGAIPGMRMDAPKTFIAGSIRAQRPAFLGTILQNGLTQGQNGFVNFSINLNGSLQGIMSGANNGGFSAASPQLNIFDGNYHWFAMSVDTANNLGSFAFDGVSMPISAVGTLSCPNWLTPIKIGGSGITNGQVGMPFNGDLAQLQIRSGGPYINLNDPNVLAQLYDSQNEEPIRIGTRGYLGPPMNVQLQISMDGPPAMFRRNLAGYPDVWDAGNSPFNLYAGQLTQSIGPDPWGEMGE